MKIKKYLILIPIAIILIALGVIYLSTDYFTNIMKVPKNTAECDSTYTVSCYDSLGIKTAEKIPCTNDVDCQIGINDYCAPGHAGLLNCPALYYCEDGYCQGCTCDQSR